MNIAEGTVIILLGIFWIVDSIRDYKRRVKRGSRIAGYLLIKFVGGSIFLIILGVLVLLGKTSVFSMIKGLFE
jgi:hypothetical protein